jgi:hypothetical protein
MISDTLHEAIEDIKNYEQTFPEVYGGIEAQISVVVTLMDALRFALDIPALSPGLVDRSRLIYQAIGAIDLSKVLAAVDCDASRPAA